MFIGTDYKLRISLICSGGEMIQSEMFLQVSLRSTTVRAEAAFVLVLFMTQLVVDEDRAVVLDGHVVACSDHPVQ